MAVVDSRVLLHPQHGRGIRRRRQCKDCNWRWTTWEFEAAQWEHGNAELLRIKQQIIDCVHKAIVEELARLRDDE